MGEDDNECVNCSEYGEHVIDKCQICEMDLCKTCSKETLISLTEWLEVSNLCKKCDRIGCRDCITTCFTCHNDNVFAGSFCIDCTELREVDCSYHEWYICDKKHIDDGYTECGSCCANRNYHLRHQY
eukprot:TRINITY_DN1535_c0_g1_i2.p1 TRINITY_DN1535_c0_g1~~TRINITY_DN1535_c0_g1_i2.p1  ORF type:complete len:127 (-),score=12.59 TRINITY_DN1535_c0_g1_i2:68-448(-)